MIPFSIDVQRQVKRRMSSPVSCMVVNTRAIAPKNSMKHVTAESWPVLRFLQLVTAWISCNRRHSKTPLIGDGHERRRRIQKNQFESEGNDRKYVVLFLASLLANGFPQLNYIYRWKQAKSQNPTEIILIENKKVTNIRASFVKT